MSFPYIFIYILMILLIGSWIFLIQLLHKTRNKATAIIKKHSQSNNLLQDQIKGIDIMMNLLSQVHVAAWGQDRQLTQQQISQTILNTACQIAQCSSGYLLIINEDTDKLFITAEKGIEQPGFIHKQISMGQGIAGRTAQDLKPMIIEDSETDARAIQITDREYNSKAWISLPLRIKNHLLGVLNLHTNELPSRFPDRILQLLTILADQSSVAIENLYTYENIQDFYLEMVETLAKTLEMKENIEKKQTGYQSLRHYAREISNILHLPDSIIKHIEMASMSYGIGKIGIDDSILRKPGKLTDEEYTQMKKHPEIAQKMISKVKYLSPSIPMILYHQERWDGKGYPAGLKGEEIPLGARIVGLLNSFNAMITDRPYRKALSKNEVIAEIEKGSNSQFDPKVVQAFIQILKNEENNLNEPKSSNSFGSSRERL